PGRNHLGRHGGCGKCWIWRLRLQQQSLFGCRRARTILSLHQRVVVDEEYVCGTGIDLQPELFEWAFCCVGAIRPAIYLNRWPELEETRPAYQPDVRGCSQ